MYMTIVLELLQQRTDLAEPLRRQRKLLVTVKRYQELKAAHDAWKQILWQRNPNSDPSRPASEAIELAIQQLRNRLLPASAPNETETLSLDESMAFLRSHTPRD